MDNYLLKTDLLDFDSLCITNLIREKDFMALDIKERIQAIYNYVRDYVLFGFNAKDNMKASSVLNEGIGQCNTKGILMMALFRACGIPCRLHGFTVNKKLQLGVQSYFLGMLTPKEIIHTWVEVCYNNIWYCLEGVILDKKYLKSIQDKYPYSNRLMGYGIATSRLKNPVIDWDMNNTFIQSEGIIKDLGIFSSPDEFYKIYHQTIGKVKSFLYQSFFRKRMNKRISNFRKKVN